MTREFQVSMDCTVTDPEGVERAGSVLITIDAATERATYALRFYHETQGKDSYIEFHAEQPLLA